MPNPFSASQSPTAAAIARLTALEDSEERLRALDARIEALDLERESVANQVMECRLRVYLGDDRHLSGRRQ